MKIDLKDIKTFYINLDKDKEKNKSMQQTISDFGFTNVERFAGIYKKNDPIAGCAASHHNIIKEHLSPVLILEDDCIIKNKNTIIEVPDDADAVYLGLSLWGYQKDISKPENYLFEQHEKFPGIYKINGMLATHAILYLTEDYLRACERIARYSEKNIVHIDQGFARIQRYYNVYALAKPIFYQSSNIAATDIQFVKNRFKRMSD